MGKGSKRRPRQTSQQEYESAWDAVFRKGKPQSAVDAQIEEEEAIREEEKKRYEDATKPK